MAINRECCKQCADNMKAQCGYDYGGTVPPCSKLVEGQKPTTNSAMDAIAELIKKYNIPSPHAVLYPRKVVDDLQAIVRQQHQ